MKETQVYYGVRLGRKDGHPFLARGNGSTPQLFYWRRDAMKFKRELAEHGCKGKIVRVEATYFFED